MNRPDPADRLVNEKKEEALEKSFPVFTNEQLSVIVRELMEIVGLIRKVAEEDDRIQADLEKRIRELEK